jgi:hypothetical protein
MATGSELSDIVLNIIQEPSADEDQVIAVFNQCAKWLSRVLILPSLDTQSPVLTAVDSNAVPLPVDFQRNLYRATDHSIVNGISVLNSRQQLIDYCGDNMTKSGKVQYIAAVRPYLYYTPIPIVATSLTLRYQRLPTVIRSNVEIDLLPDGFDDIFTNYACWKFYETIEQGLEGQKVDTQYYMALCLGLKDELELSLKEGVSLPPPPIAKAERW